MAWSIAVARDTGAGVRGQQGLRGGGGVAGEERIVYGGNRRVLKSGRGRVVVDVEECAP